MQNNAFNINKEIAELKNLEIEDSSEETQDEYQFWTEPNNTSRYFNNDYLITPLPNDIYEQCEVALEKMIKAFRSCSAKLNRRIEKYNLKYSTKDFKSKLNKTELEGFDQLYYEHTALKILHDKKELLFHSDSNVSYKYKGKTKELTKNFLFYIHAIDNFWIPDLEKQSGCILCVEFMQKWRNIFPALKEYKWEYLEPYVIHQPCMAVSLWDNNLIEDFGNGHIKTTYMVDNSGRFVKDVEKNFDKKAIDVLYEKFKSKNK